MIQQDPAGRREEAQLVSRTQSGDEGAFEVLYALHMPPIYRYAVRMTGSASDADDVVQETFLTLIRGARGFDAARGELRSYLYGVARRMVLQRLPQEAPAEIEDNELGVFDDPLIGIEREQRVQLVRSAVAGLPAAYREAVALCDLEELPYESAAAVMGCAVGTVRSRVHRARALLLERLERSGCGTAETRKRV